MPQVSILLTCYNHIDFLPACMESVLAQSFQDFEVIALDDYCSDGTTQWLEDRFRTLDSTRFRCIRNDANLGTYRTLNIGIAMATGKFVAILNDDDVWHPTKLERQITHLESHLRCGLVHTGGTFIDRAGNPLEGDPLGFQFPRTESGDVLLSLLYSNKIIASAALVRRECFEALGGFNDRYFGSGDWEMWLRIAEQYELGFIDEVLTFYRVHGGNASHKLELIWKDDEMLREWIAARAVEYGDRGYDRRELRRALAHNLACLGTVRTLNGRPKMGREAYFGSVRLEPLRIKSWLRWIATFLPREAFRKTI